MSHIRQMSEEQKSLAQEYEKENDALKAELEMLHAEQENGNHVLFFLISRIFLMIGVGLELFGPLLCV